MSKRDMRNWAYKQMRGDYPPLPLWGRLLLAIVMVAICGWIAYSLMYTPPLPSP